MRNKKIRKIVVLAMTMMVAGVLTACGSGGKGSDSEMFKTMNTVDLEGNAADSSVFAENTITLVNLWNAGCVPCIDELPAFDKLNKEYEGKGAAIKGLYYSEAAGLSDDEKEEVNGILEKAGAEYQQLTLSEDMINDNEMQSIQAFPTTYVVDSEGNIVNRIEGSNDYEGWKEFIEEELKKAEENAEK